MTTEVQAYPAETAWRNSMTRSSIRHNGGWTAIGNSKARLEVTWKDNVVAPPPTAEEIKIKELKDKLKDDTMTHKELLELLRLTGIIA